MTLTLSQVSLIGGRHVEETRHDLVILKSAKRVFELRWPCRNVPAGLKVLQPARGAALGHHVSGEMWHSYPSGVLSCIVTLPLCFWHTSSHLRRQTHA